MKKMIDLIDRVARKVTGSVEAGACVPENGLCCSNLRTYHNCYGNCVPGC